MLHRPGAVQPAAVQVCCANLMLPAGISCFVLSFGLGVLSFTGLGAAISGLAWGEWGGRLLPYAGCAWLPP